MWGTEMWVFSWAYQSFHRAVKGVPMVSPKLGVGAFEGGIAVGFGLFDAEEFGVWRVSEWAPTKEK